MMAIRGSKAGQGGELFEVLRRRARQSEAFELHRSARLRLRLLVEPRRVLPDFIIIGAHKSGTTSFFTNLIAHPQIKPPITKEVHYFDRRPLPPPEWYRAHFPAEDALRREGAITGEASPSYCLFPFVPQAVRALVPDCKLIMLLRDPVLRAYSAYQFNARRSRGAVPFEEAIARDLRLIGQEPVSIETFWRYLGEGREGRHVPTTLLRGIYIEQIKHWRSVFPAEQLVILNSRDYFRDPAGMLRSVAMEVLGLSDHVFTYRDSRNDKRPYPKMPEDTYLRLRRFFAPYNERLYEYIGRDFGW
jgi:hypothetical protein